VLSKKLVRVLLIIIFAISLAGCSKGQKPEDTLNSYIAQWQKQDFASMYKSLSSSSKDAVSEKDFIDKHKNIYNGIALSSISIVPQYSKDMKPDKEGKLTVPLNVTMETAAGTLSFSNQAVILKEKQDGKEVWAVNWTQQMIFPQLKEQSDKIRVTTKQPRRGEIWDRNGSALALNGNAVSIGIIPQMMGQDKEPKEQLSIALGINVEQIDKQLSASWVKPDLFVPITSIPQSDSRVAELMKIKGVTKQSVSARVYPLKEAAAQLTGYIGTITAEEYEKLKSEGYSDTDVVGKAGLEQANFFSWGESL
jgi:penicillin-binding protein